MPGRLRARLSRDDRGFTLIETMIAITVIVSSLFALAYAATIGFGYMDQARQKDAATGIANQIMEDARGLAYSKITTGMLDTDLTGDSRIVSCSGVYRFLSCSAPPTNGSGEKIVYSASPTAVNPTQPLVPHTGTITNNGVAYSWAIYDTQDDTVTNGPFPYRLTVIVTWSAGHVSSSKVVQIQSLFWSPTGCHSTSLHPFAAPCQPFFFGSASVPAGDINIAGSVDGTAFSSGDLLTPDVESNAQVEQVSQVQGSVTRSAVSVTDNGTTSTAGGAVATTTAADTDPGSSGGVYSRTRCPTDVTCAGGSVTSASGSGTTSFTFTAPTGDTFETDSTTSASASNACPPPTATGETDTLPCGGSREQQGGTLSAVLGLNGISAGLGSATVSQVLQAASSPDTTFVNRVAFGTSALCTPISTSDGCLEQTVSRTFGTINIGGLPSGMTAPASWAGAGAWNGYFLSIVGYQDTANAAAGVSAPLPTATVSAGTVYYWNGAGYSSLAATAAGLSAINPTLTLSQVIGGHTVIVNMSLQSSTTAAATTSTSATPATAGNVTRTDVTASVIPPRTAVVYTISVDGSTEVSLVITVNLKSMDVRGSYAAAPAQGS